VDTCSHCGVELPPDAMFCPSCGRRVDAPPPDPAELLAAVPSREPHYYGLAKPLLVLGVAAALLIGGVVVLITSSFGLGMILIVLGVCLLPSFAAGLRRWPDTRFARVSLTTAGRVRDEADVAVQSFSAWSRTGRDIVRMRRQQFQLRRERDVKIRELGVAAYADDGRAEELKRAAKELDRQIEANERTIERAIARARRRVRKERATVAQTEVIEPKAIEPEAIEPEVIEPERPTEEDVRRKPRKAS
jgi:hypothetical protein